MVINIELVGKITPIFVLSLSIFNGLSVLLLLHQSYILGFALLKWQTWGSASKESHMKLMGPLLFWWFKFIVIENCVEECLIICLFHDLLNCVSFPHPNHRHRNKRTSHSSLSPKNPLIWAAFDTFSRSWDRLGYSLMKKLTPCDQFFFIHLYTFR